MLAKPVIVSWKAGQSVWWQHEKDSGERIGPMVKWPIGYWDLWTGPDAGSLEKITAPLYLPATSRETDADKKARLYLRGKA